MQGKKASAGRFVMLVPPVPKTHVLMVLNIGINEHYSSLQRQALFLRVQLGSTMD
jgi:hypothetical protein